MEQKIERNILIPSHQRRKITLEQKERLVNVYKKYRNTFSDLPGKAKNFVCELEFHNPIKFNKKILPHCSIT